MTVVNCAVCGRSCACVYQREGARKCSPCAGVDCVYCKAEYSTPTTPTSLPQNREAEAWRERCNDAQNALWNTRIAVFPLALVCGLLFVALVSVVQERDAARARVAAAEHAMESIHRMCVTELFP